LYTGFTNANAMLQGTKSLRDSQLKRLICGPAKQDTDRR
jgi:hypothetical protein